MRSFISWLNALRKELRVIFTGSLLLTGMGLAQGVWNAPISRLAYSVVILLFFVWAVFSSWNKERQTREAAEQALATRKNKEKIKAGIMQFVSEAQVLIGRCPNSLGSNEEAQLWIELMGEWRDKVDAFLMAECSEIAMRRFETLAVRKDSTFMYTHPNCHTTKGVTHTLIANLLHIIEQLDVYL